MGYGQDILDAGGSLTSFCVALGEVRNFWDITIF